MTYLDKFKKENPLLFKQEKLILTLTELIYGIIEDENINLDDLCKKLCKSKKWLNRFLDGRGKMKFRDICNIFSVLDYDFNFNICKRVLK